MKKSKLASWTFMLFLLVTAKNLNAQQYYWSDNRKIQIVKDDTAILIKARKGSAEELSLQRGKEFESLERINDQNILVRMKTSKTAMIEELHTISDNLISSFRTDSGEEMIPTGELLLMPKKNVNIREIENRIGENLIVSNQKYNSYTIQIEELSELLTVANKIYESGLVTYCHPNFIMKIEKHQTNDPIYPNQYYLNNTGQFGGTVGVDINAPQAWNVSTGLHKVRVAVIDDGVENHVDINGRVVQGYSPRNSNGFGAPINNGDHGQACAGIIGATRNNNEGIAGINGCTEIVPINIFLGSESSADIANAIDWAWDDGQADVLSNSWGYTNPGTYFDNINQAIQRARTQGRNGKGSIVVFSSGNSNAAFSGVTFPANVSGVITVGAIDNDGNIWGYSSRGPEMDIVAPSGNTNQLGDVRTTDRTGTNGYVNGNYVNTFGGTSAACPQVAGAAALMLSINRSLTESQVSSILKASAIEMGTGTFNNTYGHGRLDVEEALLRSIPSIAGPTNFCPSGVMSVDVPAGGNVTWSVNPSNALNFTQGQANSTFTRNGSFLGLATITAVISSGCGSITAKTKNVQIGGKLDLNAPSFITNPSINVSASGGTSPYKWYWNNVLIATSGSSNITLQLTCGGGTLRVEANSPCGTLSDSRTIVVSCSGGYFMTVYPNPSSSEIFIRERNQLSEGSYLSSSLLQGLTQLKLYDFTGTMVKQVPINNRKDIKMTISDFKKGTYFLRIIGKEIDEVHQIIIK